MEFYVIMLAVGLVQMFLCFCRGKLVIRLLPLLSGAVMEAASWIWLFAAFSKNGDPGVDAAALITLGIMVGIQIMFSAGLAWAIYGLTCLVKKLRNS